MIIFKVHLVSIIVVFVLSRSKVHVVEMTEFVVHVDGGATEEIVADVLEKDWVEEPMSFAFARV